MTDEEVVWAVQEVRDQLKRQNAILAAMLNEMQNHGRAPDEEPTSYRATETSIDSMAFTLYEDQE